MCTFPSSLSHSRHKLAHSSPRNYRCSTVRPQALFQLFGGSTSTLSERPLYRQSDSISTKNIGKISPMGIGTWAWGNKLLWDYDESMDDELRQVFNTSLASGINFFDTADSYGTGKLNGRSEQLLGSFLDDYPGSNKTKSNVKIATKLAAYPWRLTPNQWVNAAKASLKRTGQDQLGLVQLHWSTSNYAPLQERLMWDGLVAIYEQGLAEGVGVSNFGPKQLQKIHAYLEKRGVPLTAVQVQYSLLSRGKEQEAVRAAAKDLDLALIAYSPLALGLLSGKYHLNTITNTTNSNNNKLQEEATVVVLPGGPRGYLFKKILPGLAPLQQVVSEISRNRKKTASQVAVNWCICQGTVPIVGVKNMGQLKDNMGAMGWRLSEGEVEALEDAADMVPVQMQQNIFQTK
jgi:pyridoxine 4-dehydrogenase